MIDFAELREGLTPETLGYGVILPAVVTGGVLAAATRLPERARRHDGLFGALAVALSVTSGYFALELGDAYKPEFGDHWLPYLTLLAVPAGWVAGRGRPAWLVVLVVGLTAAAAVLPIDLGPWPLRWQHCAIAGGISLVAALGLIYSRLSAPWTLIATALASMAAGYLLLDIGLIRHPQMAGLQFAAGAAGAVVLAALERDPDKRLVRGMSPGYAVFMSGLMLTGSAGAGRIVSPLCYIAIAAAPAGLLVTLLPAVARRTAPTRILVAGAALIAPLAVALFLSLN